jgi:outer membrane protein assembly factor BamB
MEGKTVFIVILLAASCSGQALLPRQTSRAGAAREWTQYGFLPAHTSFNSGETILRRSNVARLTWQWAGEIGNSSASAPVVGGGIVYVAADGMVFAFRSEDGTKLWSRLSCSGVGTVQPALGTNALLVGDSGGAWRPTIRLLAIRSGVTMRVGRSLLRRR